MGTPVTAAQCGTRDVQHHPVATAAPGSAFPSVTPKAAQGNGVSLSMVQPHAVGQERGLWMQLCTKTELMGSTVISSL